MSLRVGHIIPDILLSDLGFVPGKVMKLFKKVVVCFCTRPDPQYITVWTTVLSPRSPVSNVGRFRL